MIHVGECLKAIRINKGYTQVYVASKVGVPQHSVSRTERTADPRVSTLMKYLEMYDYPYGTFFAAAKECERLRIP